MNKENDATERDTLPFDLSDDLGTIVHSECICPGVWYVVNEGNGRVGIEYYIVERDAPCISEAAKERGMFLPHHPELLAYRLDEPERGRSIVEYEAARYCRKNGVLEADESPLLVTAVYGMEDNPDYFGSYPAPIHTPRGTLTRYKAIVNGVFVLETDQCERMIAVCYPIWDASLSDYTKASAEQTAYDRERGIDTTLGYLFFTEKNGCLALFELLGEFPEILSNPLIDAAALNNALWQYHPDYAAIYNRDEQEGLHDSLALLLNFLGAEVEPVVWPDRLIKLTLGVGTDYLKF